MHQTVLVSLFLSSIHGFSLASRISIALLQKTENYADVIYGSSSVFLAGRQARRGGRGDCSPGQHILGQVPTLHQRQEDHLLRRRRPHPLHW